jgi:hypothetical protein
MWRDLFRRHCSDETLLAHMDGELSIRRAGVNRHLRTCWLCRARMAKIEEQAQSLATAFEEQTFPGPRRIVEAQGRFWARVEQYERSLSPAPQFRSVTTARRHHVWAAAACVLVLAGGLIVGRRTNREPDTTEVLAAIGEVEQRLLRPSLLLHQELRIEIRQTRPGRSLRTSRFEVWHEPSSGRFASRWNDVDGVLRYASWRTEEKREYAYAPPGQSSEQAVEVRSLALLGEGGWEPQQLEAAFFEWLRTRKKTPVSFASDFRAFSLERGVVAGLRRVREPDGGTVLRLWARRDTRDGRMELILDVDAVTYRPRLQAIRFQSAARDVEFRMIAQRMETARFSDMVFEPVRERIDSPLPAVRPQRRAAGPSQARKSAPSESELDRVELEVQYALHRARACLGEPIRVERGSDGKIRVEGLVETVARRAQIAGVLAELDAVQMVTVDLHTAEESIGQTDYGPEGTVGATRVGPTPLPIQAALEQYFAERRDRGEAITDLTNQAVTESKALSGEAWALRRLAERYGQKKTEDLALQSRWLLEVMIRDHADALVKRVRRSRTLLDPVLSLAAGGKQGAETQREEEGPFWSTVYSLFLLAEKTSTLIQALFAGDGLPLEDATSPGGPMRLMAGGEAAARLAGVLDELMDRLERFEILVSQEFPGRPQTQPAK